MTVDALEKYKAGIISEKTYKIITLGTAQEDSI